MFTDYKTRKDRMTKKSHKKPSFITNGWRITTERWYTGKVYLHIPLVPFKVRIA
jgi:hypothetical protein